VSEAEARMAWRARVFVTPKQGILDPQGKAVQHSLHTLGYSEVTDVRIGKVIELHLADISRDSAATRVREMCERLLANAVIEDFSFTIDEPS
jgi:phosphoribosylformylglycinamidine synthase PurS subunit